MYVCMYTVRVPPKYAIVNARRMLRASVVRNAYTGYGAFDARAVVCRSCTARCFRHVNTLVRYLLRHSKIVITNAEAD